MSQDEIVRQNIIYWHPHHSYKPRNVNEIHKEQNVSSFNQKLAVTFTKYFGSVQAFYILVVWMFIWIALATSGIWLFGKDPYPFQFLLFLSNLVQLWALPVIMVGQNTLSKHQEIQAEETYKDAEKSVHDIEHMINHMNEQDKELLKQSRIIEEIAFKLNQSVNNQQEMLERISSMIEKQNTQEVKIIKRKT